MKPKACLHRLQFVKYPFIAACLLYLIAGAGGCRRDNAFAHWVVQLQDDEALAAMRQIARASFAVVKPEVLDSALSRNERYRRQLALLEERPLSRMQLLQRDSLLRILQENKLEWSQWQTDPSLYNLSGEVRRLLSQHHLPMNERLLAIDQCLSQAVNYYQAAKRNLRRPAPDRSMLAAQKQLLGLRLLAEELPDSISRASLEPQLGDRLLSNSRKARLQMKDYIAFCESILFEHRDSLMRRR